MTRLFTLAEEDRRVLRSAVEVHRKRSTWSRPEMLASLVEINERYLDVLVTQSASGGLARTHALLQHLRPLLTAMNAAARRRAATCPYLLADVGFADVARWIAPRAEGALEPVLSVAEPDAVITPQVTALTRLVFIYAWHLSRTHVSAARMVLGMPAPTTEILRGYTLRQITDLAESNPQWLQPRWPYHLRMWRELLCGAIEGEGDPLDQARMRGVQLLAAEARSSALP